VLTRQNLPILDRKTLAPSAGVKKGGYVLWEAGPVPEVLIIGTGSEVHIALDAGKVLQEKGVKARVVSMPSWELFDAQPDEYQKSVLPPEIKARVSIEAGIPMGWEKYVGSEGAVIGISRFGASAPGNVVYEKLGITSQHVVNEALQLISRRQR
jgi:transketolase